MIFVVDNNPVSAALKMSLKNTWAVIKAQSPYERFHTLGCHAQTFFVLDPRNMEFETSYCDKGSSTVDEVSRYLDSQAFTDILSKNK